MTIAGVLPINDDQSLPPGVFITFVVPAPDGCNLKCAFCVVRQRREITEDHLQPIDLARFIHEAVRRIPIFALAIQGYEPLLPASRDYTQSILATGQLLGLPTTFVTNGVFLRNSVEWLATLRPDTIAVSLDAALPAAHDRIRGVTGAWASTVDGVRRAVEILSPSTTIAVASVLASSHKPLEGVPSLLRNLGVAHWIITPLQKIGRDHPGGPVGDRGKLYKNLLILQQAADDAGIRLTIDDELDCLRHNLAVARRPELARLHVRTLPEGVDLIRLTPSGQCSMNRDILRQVTPAALRWRPGEMDASRFIESLGAASPSPHRPASPCTNSAARATCSLSGVA
jgi:MoaA/NifB/PqqE/SkfB family radical SAM enzyme